jgi:hypothetical protein
VTISLVPDDAWEADAAAPLDPIPPFEPIAVTTLVREYRRLLDSLPSWARAEAEPIDPAAALDDVRAVLLRLAALSAAAHHLTRRLEGLRLACTTPRERGRYLVAVGSMAETVLQHGDGTPEVDADAN